MADRSVLAGVAAAAVASSCCILPLALAAAGVAGLGLMHTTMAFEVVTLPAGVLGLAAAWTLHLREASRCPADGCPPTRRRVTVAVLLMATVVVAVSVLLRLMPSWTAAIVETMVG